MKKTKATLDRATRDEDAFLNQFPNLVPELERGYSVYRLGEEKQDQRSIIIGERVRFAGLLKAIGRASHEARVHGRDGDAVRDAGLRAAHAYFRRSYDLRPEEFSRDVERFVSAIKRSRRLLFDLVKNFFPKPYQRQLEMTSDVESENDPIRLIRLCCGSGSDVLSERRRFEARRQLTLAQLLFEFQLFGNGPDDLDRDMSRFDDDLKRSFFLPQKSASYKIVTELSPNNAYRVRRDGLKVLPLGPGAHRLHSTATRRMLSTDMRFIKAGGREIPIYYEIRVKHDAVWKLIRKCQRQTVKLDDLCGVKFVFLDDRDLLDGVDHFRRTAATEPGCYFGDASNMASAGVVDDANVHSASEYRAKKYFGIKYRRLYEIQVMLLRDWINEQFSRGDENHNLYRLRTFQHDLFPRLFPTVFYHLDWRDARLRKTLVDLQLAKIWSI